MNEFSFSAFLGYLIIAILGGAAAAVLATLVLGRPRHSFSRILFIVAAAAAAVFGYFKIHNSRLVMQVDRASSIPTASPTPTPVPAPGTELSSDMRIQQAKAVKGSDEDNFIHAVIAAPPNATRRAGQWAVVIAGADREEGYPQVGTAVSAAISDKGQSNIAIFRPSVLRPANFETLFAADAALDRKLGDYCDYVFVGKVTSSSAQNSQLADLISVTLILNARIISTKTGGIVGQFEAQAVGAGGSLPEARANAEERLAAEVGGRLRDLIK